MPVSPEGCAGAWTGQRRGRVILSVGERAQVEEAAAIFRISSSLRPPWCPSTYLTLLETWRVHAPDATGCSVGKKHHRTLVATSGGRSAIVAVPEGFSIAIWDLAPPTIEYHAESFSLAHVNGEPTMFFGQRAGKNLINAVALAIARSRFEDLKGAWSTIEAMMPARLEAFGAVELLPDIASAEIEALNTSSFKKFHSSLCRAVCDNDSAMLDFYSVPLIPPQQQIRSPEEVEDLITPQIRVYCSVVLLDRIIRTMKGTL